MKRMVIQIVDVSRCRNTGFLSRIRVAALVEEKASQIQ